MKKFMTSTLLALAALTASSQAAITFIAPTSTTAGSVVSDAPIVFTITTAGSPIAVILDEWVTSDGTRSDVFFGSPTPRVSYQINGGIVRTAPLQGFNENYTTTFRDYTPNDGMVQFQATAPVIVGDVFTILPFSGVIDPSPGYNSVSWIPQSRVPYTGNVFLMGSNGFRISGTALAGAAVPEPTSALLLGLGGGLALLRRRRR
jgi:PEP-CTERM motif